MRETYWATTVQTWKDGPDGPVKGVSTHFAQATLGEAIAHAFNDASYYIVTCGYRVTVEMEEVCEFCNGLGTVKGKRGQKRCPICKGVTPPGRVPPTTVALHHNTTGATV